jgi:hypothetical protein
MCPVIAPGPDGAQGWKKAAYQVAECGVQLAASPASQK